MPEPKQTAPSGKTGRSVLPLPFLICAIILAGTALWLRQGMVKISVMMQKEPIALRKPLNQFDRSRLKSFRRPTFPSDTKLDFEAIGTKDALCEQYISVDPELGTDPVELFVTYYSDPKDKVPHTPEVCYRQVDTSVESMTSITIDTPGLAPKHPAIDVRRLVLSQQGSKAVILYLFYTNGRTYYDR